MPAKWLGRYELVDRIARGGMGEIFLAHFQGNPGRPVVLKVVRTDSTERRHVQMFLDEARVSTLVQHPNVVRVYEVNYQDGAYYLAMERLRGLPLATLMNNARDADRFLPLRVVVRVGLDVCAALTAVHECTTEDGRAMDLVHRDVSPGNLFVTTDGTVKLLDFGVAKSAVQVGQTALGLIKGTAPYMSPEQVRGNPLDRRSDMFSLGTILYECLVGDRLFKKESVYETLSAVCFKPMIPPVRPNEEIPASLAAAVLSALSRERDKRIDSAATLSVLLEHVAAEILGGPVTSKEVAGFAAEMMPDPGRVGRQTQTVTAPGDLESWADGVSERLRKPGPGELKPTPASVLQAVPGVPDPFQDSHPGDTAADVPLGVRHDTRINPRRRDDRPTVVDPLAGAALERAGSEFSSVTPAEPVSAEALALDPSAPEFVAFTPVDGQPTPLSRPSSPGDEVPVQLVDLSHDPALTESGVSDSAPTLSDVPIASAVPPPPPADAWQTLTDPDPEQAGESASISQPRMTVPELPPGLSGQHPHIEPRVVSHGVSPATPARRRRRWPWVLLVLALLGAGGGYVAMVRGLIPPISRLLPRR